MILRLKCLIFKNRDSYIVRENTNLKPHQLLTYLNIEGKSVFLEGVEVKHQLLSTFGERGQVAIAVHVDRLALEDLQSLRCAW